MAKSFAQALETSKVDSTTKKSSKSSMPVISDAPAEVKTAVDTVNAAKAEIKKQKAIQTKAESHIIDYVQPIQDRDGFAMRHSKSYEVEGNETSIKYVTSNRFTVNIDDKNNLVDVLGQDGFDDRFEIKKSLKAKDAIFSDEDLQKRVMDALGDELFGELFEYSETLAVKKDFDKLQFALDKDTLSDLRVFAKQYKASLK